MSVEIEATDKLRQQVFTLIKAWEDGTACLSFINDEHPACQALISFGGGIVPLILERLKLMPSMQVLFLLTILTGKNPAKEEHRGKVILMAGDWIEWGKKNGFI